MPSPTLSLELAPNTDDASLAAVLALLKEVQPAFVSVRYRPDGPATAQSVLATAKVIQQQARVTPLVHLPAVQVNRAMVTTFLADARAAQLDHFLIVRGDWPDTGRVSHDFPHASDLMAFIQQRSDATMVGACYPAGHPESPDAAHDIAAYVAKTQAGAKMLLSQIFFANADFLTMVTRCRAAGIKVPIIAGIMPITSRAQAEHITAMTGVALPATLTTALRRCGDNLQAQQDAGIAFAVAQIKAMVAAGVDGIHLFTLADHTATRRIFAATQPLFVTNP